MKQPIRGKTVMINGATYFIIGTTRIKVTEHFQKAGKTLSVLVEDMISNMAQHQQEPPSAH